MGTIYRCPWGFPILGAAGCCQLAVAAAQTIALCGLSQAYARCQTCWKPLSRHNPASRSRPSVMAVESTYASRVSVASPPQISVARFNRYRTVFGCTLNVRAVASKDATESRKNAHGLERRIIGIVAFERLID